MTTLPKEVIESRISRKQARHIVATFLNCYTTLFDSLDEDVYRGFPENYLPKAVQHLSEFETENSTTKHFFPNDSEKELIKAEALKIWRVLNKMTIQKP